MVQVTAIAEKPGETFREHVYRLLRANNVTTARTGRESAGRLPHVAIDVVGLSPELHTNLLVFCRAALSSSDDPDAELERFQHKIMCILIEGSPLTLPLNAWRVYGPTPAFEERPRAKVQSKELSKPRVLTAVIPVEEA